MKHPKNKLQKLIFLVRQQKHGKKLHYFFNSLLYYKFYITKMIDKEWNSYLYHLKKENERMTRDASKS